MSKLRCTCGWSVSDVLFPNPNKHHLISDEDLDGITRYGPATIDNGGFRDRAREVLECSECGRLHVEDAPDVNHFTPYVKQVAYPASREQALESALAQLLWTHPGDPGYDGARATAGKILKREE